MEGRALLWVNCARVRGLVKVLVQSSWASLDCLATVILGGYVYLCLHIKSNLFMISQSLSSELLGTIGLVGHGNTWGYIYFMSAAVIIEPIHVDRL